MAATLGAYSPIFYANEALILLEKALGMGNRVYMGYDEERKTFDKGQTISIRKPGVFTAEAAPGTAVEPATQYVDITLDQWYTVKFKLTDKELAYTGQRIIDEHIAPAAYALADNIDQALVALYTTIPWYEAMDAGTADLGDVTELKAVAFNNKVPFRNDGKVHVMASGTQQAA